MSQTFRDIVLIAILILVTLLIFGVHFGHA